jgi:hypothetical protein
VLYDVHDGPQTVGSLRARGIHKETDQGLFEQQHGTGYGYPRAEAQALPLPRTRQRTLSAPLSRRTPESRGAEAYELEEPSRASASRRWERPGVSSSDCMKSYQRLSRSYARADSGV